MNWMAKILLLLCMAGTLQAQNDLIEVQSMVDTSEIYIGDRINYSILLKHAENLRVEQPGEGLHLGMFEIKEFNFSEPLNRGGFITRRYDFTISVFDTGSFTIPAFPIAYFPDSSQYKIIEAAPIEIHVKSLLSAEDAPQLKDIKPPLDIPFDYVLLYSVIAVILVLALAAFFGYRMWKASKEPGFIFSAPPKQRPAHEVALQALRELYNSDLLDNAQYKAFFSKLSEIVRIYIEGRFFVTALEETTWEILRDIRSHLNDRDMDNLTFILEQSDLVKFAKYFPDKGTIDDLKEQTQQFIHDTKIILKQENNSPQSDINIAAEQSIQKNTQEEKGD